MSARPLLAFFGSSLVSAYWNGAATYYRGILKYLAANGWRIHFYEPDAYDRQAHRDIADPPWARVIVYSAASDDDALRALDDAARADIVIKASGIGVFDELLEAAVPERRKAGQICGFWDVDAPATLDRLRAAPDAALATHLSLYDLVLTYGGGPEIVRDYLALGARRCTPIYNAVDPDTHYPVAPVGAFGGDLSLLANRLPDREARIDQFYFDVARRLPDYRLVLGGSGWVPGEVPANVHCTGHVYTRDHNAFNCSSRAVLNVNRDSMARVGYSPATRVFEAAGAGACMITDAWRGIEMFFEPGTEILVATSGAEVATHLLALTTDRARRMGGAARRRVLAEHTYAHRVGQIEEALGVAVSGRS
jgi:spore maturation protein CgeB